MHTIPPEAQRLADRLRALADEIESAASYGIPIPGIVSASGHEYGDVGFAATPEEFTAWAEYVEAEPVRDALFHSVEALVGPRDLPLRFHVPANLMREVSA